MLAPALIYFRLFLSNNTKHMFLKLHTFYAERKFHTPK